MSKYSVCLFGFIGFVFALQLNANIVLETSKFKIGINQKGHIEHFLDKTSNREYLLKLEESPLLTIRVNNELEWPSSMEKKGNKLVLNFSRNNIEAHIQYETKPEYITFELTKISKNKSVDLVIWGPYPTIIQKTIGESIGVVRNDHFAIGIQALNVKTLGGYPTNENDTEPSYDIFDSENLVDVDESIKFLYRGQTAIRTEGGSLLQAYTRNRNRTRIISNWGHSDYVVPAYDDGGVEGSKIALFGCDPGNVLNTISEIEVREGLPHPMIDGEWVKTAKGATASYIITSFSEDNLDKAIQLTKDAGLEYLYHGGPFETWGHFKLKENAFPDNWESMKRCVIRAQEKGIKLGIHTLSNFITTNDPYVTPKPDNRLAKVGSSILMENIDKNSTEIVIQSPVYFNQMENNSLHSVVVGDEIIRYRAVSDDEPWKLLGCVRGVFGTKATSHGKGDTIGKLMDHGYKVFLGDEDLNEEIAIRIADLFNITGLRQISFDGLEGTWSTGMGQYARNLFTKTWYDSLSPELRGNVINDASNPSHFNWHINTRYNWGEPWYAGFRESQTQYRLMNQDFYRRNYLPSMLGWFNMTSQTSIEDTEWLLARAAGFDAGFAFNLSLETIEKNGLGDQILKTIKTWESARMADAFTEEQKRRMEDINNEFHLQQKENGDLLLYPYYIRRYVHEQKMRQPGEPLFSTYGFENPYNSQDIMFIIKLLPINNTMGSDVSKINIEVNNTQTIEFLLDMKPSNILKLNDNGVLSLYDANWNLIEEIDYQQDLPVLSNGNNEIIIDADFEGGGSSKLDLEIKTRGEAELITPISN